jgi:hypothetical protein
VGEGEGGAMDRAGDGCGDGIRGGRRAAGMEAESARWQNEPVCTPTLLTYRVVEIFIIFRTCISPIPPMYL